MTASRLLYEPEWRHKFGVTQAPQHCALCNLAKIPAPIPHHQDSPIFIAGVKMKSQSQHKDSRRQKEINMQYSHAPRDMQTPRCFDFPLALTKRNFLLPFYRFSLAVRDKNREYSSYKASFCPQDVLSPNWKAFLRSSDGISCKQQQQWSINPVKLSGHYMYRQFNIQQFYVLPTQCIYVFFVDLRTNSDYFPIQQ